GTHRRIASVTRPRSFAPARARSYSSAPWLREPERETHSLLAKWWPPSAEHRAHHLDRPQRRSPPLRRPLRPSDGSFRCSPDPIAPDASSRGAPLYPEAPPKWSQPPRPLRLP